MTRTVYPADPEAPISRAVRAGDDLPGDREQIPLPLKPPSRQTRPRGGWRTVGDSAVTISGRGHMFMEGAIELQ
jgi:hypothetical protein